MTHIFSCIFTAFVGAGAVMFCIFLICCVGMVAAEMSLEPLKEIPWFILRAGFAMFFVAYLGISFVNGPNWWLENGKQTEESPIGGDLMALANEALAEHADGNKKGHPVSEERGDGHITNTIAQKRAILNPSKSTPLETALGAVAATSPEGFTVDNSGNA